LVFLLLCESSPQTRLKIHSAFLRPVTRFAPPPTTTKSSSDTFSRYQIFSLTTSPSLSPVSSAPHWRTSPPTHQHYVSFLPGLPSLPAINTCFLPLNHFIFPRVITKGFQGLPSVPLLPPSAPSLKELGPTLSEAAFPSHSSFVTLHEFRWLFSWELVVGPSGSFPSLSRPKVIPRLSPRVHPPGTGLFRYQPDFLRIKPSILDVRAF